MVGRDEARSAGRKDQVWKRQCEPGHLGRLVDFNTRTLRPDRLLVQESDAGYVVIGRGEGAVAALKWLERAENASALDQAAATHPQVPHWVRGIADDYLRRLATAEALAGGDTLQRYNPNHYPSGTPGGVGGQFAPRDAAGTMVADNTTLQTDVSLTVDPDADPPLAVPAYRADVFANSKQQEGWSAFQPAVRNLPNSTSTIVYIFAMTYAAEGGLAVAPNYVVAGLNQTDLKGAQEVLNSDGDPLYPDLADVANPMALSASQVAEVYAYMANQDFAGLGGYAALNQIHNQYAAAALFDTLFWSGASKGAWLVQRAINDVEPGTVKVDSQMGPATLNAYGYLAQKSPQTLSSLLEALANERTSWATQKRQLDKNRIDYFSSISLQ